MPVQHATFSISRVYKAAPIKVFDAFADPVKKRRWFAEGDGFEVREHALDFRVGGVETTRFATPAASPLKGAELRNDTTYFDISPAARIVLAYSMSVAGRCISVSLATFEFNPDGAGTAFTFTEQAAFFEGSDGPAIREDGWRHLLDRLTAEVDHV